MPVKQYGQKTETRRAEFTYTGPKLTVVPYYKFPIYRSDDVQNRWWPGKTNENGGGVICYADLEVTIDGMRGNQSFPDAVIANGKNGGGLVAMAAQSYDPFLVGTDKDGNEKIGGRKPNYDWGADINNEIRNVLNHGAEALTEDVLSAIYEDWDVWAQENDEELLRFYYTVVLRQAYPYDQAPPAPPVQQTPPPRQQRPAAPPAAPPAPATQATQQRRPAPKTPPVQVPADDETDDENFGAQTDPFGE